MNRKHERGSIVTIVSALVIVSILVFFFIYSQYVARREGQSAKSVPVANAPKVKSRLAHDAYSALKRLEATTESGVNITEYSKQRAEAWFQVKTYLESPDAKSGPELTKAFGDAIIAHEKAAAVWRVTIEEPNNDMAFTKGKVPYWAKSLRDDVPDLDRFLFEDYIDKTRDRYRLKEALQEYWGDASQSLKTVAARFQ